MILWWSEKRKVKQVKGGALFRETCPKCGVQATFVECVASSSLEFFSVLDVLDDEKRVLVCSECEEQFELDPARAASATEPERPAPRAATSPPAPAPPRPSAASRRAAAASPEIEDRLTALKRKMNK
jgi:hypothetical protein